MENKTQSFFGKIASFDEAQRFVDAIICHFDKPNENYWMPQTGCLDAFLARLGKAKKNIPAYYQHDDRMLIGHWENIVIEGGEMKGRLMLDDIPFVNEVVIPQLKSGSLQGASPTISPVEDFWSKDLNVWVIIEGVIIEASLVGLPADLRADITSVKASLEAQRQKDTDFEISLL